MRVKRYLLILLLFSLATTAAVVARRVLMPVEERTPIPLSAIPKTPPVAIEMGTPRPDFSLPDLAGESRAVGEWDGKVLVVNFWATWCPPCIREIPGFVELQEEYGTQGVQFVGIAIDSLDKVSKMSDSLEINYPILIGEDEAIEIAGRYGNKHGALPYTVVVDRSGAVVFARQGDMKKSETEKIVQGLL